jgi:trans-aconitate methyltransferase
MRKPEEAWRRWGELDPYYGVLAEQKYRANELETNRAAFFESGQRYVAELLRNLGRLHPDAPRRVAVDFGCGVGRLLIPLSQHFESVAGIDISPGMLSEAKRNCAALHNVRFLDLESVPDGLSLVHSFIVFQHMPVKEGLRIMKLLFSRLASGGIAALHFTVGRQPSLHKRFVYLGKHRIPGFHRLANLLQGKRLDEPLMQINSYSIDRVCAAAQVCGMCDVCLLPSTDSPFGLTLFARKE